MATTNKEIIATYKMMNNIPLDEPLFTYAAWKAKGYQVRKGEVCHHRVTLWKHSEKKVEVDGQQVDSCRCFHKTANLFEMSQVDKIES